ncbi:unnamed protein product [Ixodes pacificus]
MTRTLKQGGDASTNIHAHTNTHSGKPAAATPQRVVAPQSSSQGPRRFRGRRSRIQVRRKSSNARRSRRPSIGFPASACTNRQLRHSPLPGSRTGRGQEAEAARLLHVSTDASDAATPQEVGSHRNNAGVVVEVPPEPSRKRRGLLAETSTPPTSYQVPPD